jgi:peptidoglycan/LPS O-acetylase OafA/YrhL
MAQPMMEGARIAPTVVSARTKAAARYEVLDSWRGICALLVALFHFPAANHISDTAFVRSAFLFVDFFFVLSGFVIASGYSRRLGDAESAARFAFVRFGRLYPLHLFMLAAFVAFDALHFLAPGLRGAGTMPGGDGFDWGVLVQNIFMVHGLGFAGGLSWNGPSWSISCEFFAYLAFAAVMLALGRRAWIALAVVALAGPLVLLRWSPHYMDATWDFGFVRCLYGFSLGVLLAWSQGTAIGAARRGAVQDDFAGRLSWTVAELATVAAIAIFVAQAGRGAAGVVAPFVFAFAINVFAHERGLVSDLLRSRPLLWLGALSYSIYMVHIFVQARMTNVAGLLDRKLHTDILGPMLYHGEPAIGFGAGSAAVGLAATVLMIATTVAAAYFSWRFVEMPALQWFRRRAGRF